MHSSPVMGVEDCSMTSEPRRGGQAMACTNMLQQPVDNTHIQRILNASTHSTTIYVCMSILRVQWCCRNQEATGSELRTQSLTGCKEAHKWRTIAVYRNRLANATRRHNSRAVAAKTRTWAAFMLMSFKHSLAGAAHLGMLGYS